MKNRKKLIISIFSLALCVLVTFAWINELQNPTGRILTLRMNDAEVATSELKVKLSVNVAEDTYEEITKRCEEVSDMELEAYDNFAPGSRKKFKVDITNLSTSSVNLRVVLSDIVCENEELRDSIIIGTNGFDGFDANYPAPTVQNKMLSDGINDSGGFVLVDSVEIPPHSENESVSVYFYVMFSAAGSENLENMSFSIGTINFITL